MQYVRLATKIIGVIISTGGVLSAISELLDS